MKSPLTLRTQPIIAEFIEQRSYQLPIILGCNPANLVCGQTVRRRFVLSPTNFIIARSSTT